MRCFSNDVLSEGQGRSKRAAARKSLKEASDEEEDYDMHELEREAEILSGKSGPGRGSKKKAPKAEQVDKVTNDLASISVAKPNKSAKTESTKPRSAVKSVSSAAEASSSFPSPRSETRAGDDVAMGTSPGQEPPAVAHPKKKRRARKSAAADGGKYKPPKSEESSESDELPEKPRRKKTKRKSAADNDPTS